VIAGRCSSRTLALDLAPDLLAIDRDRSRRGDPQPDAGPPDLQHLDHHVVADDDPLAGTAFDPEHDVDLTVSPGV
jgi:hypothetical protein